MKRDSVLIVDDEEINRLILEEMFKGSFKVLTAENGLQAKEIIEENDKKIAVVILDLEMPVMNGYDFLRKARFMPEMEQIPVIVATADDGSNAEITALDYGVTDVVRKPYDARVILRRVRNVVSLFDYKERVEDLLQEQTYKLDKRERELAKVNEHLIDALSSVVEFRDLETGEHIQRIKDYTRIMCDTMMREYPDCRLTEHDCNLIVAASSMHDIGKISIPDAILLKPGKLTPEEFEIIKTHTTKGAQLLDKVNLIEDNEYLEYSKNICLYHHEKYDGKGYPKGLKGEEIPLEAQIVGIADVFDALVSKRIYKEAFSINDSYNMILNGECGEFSDRIKDCFKKSSVKFKNTALFSYALKRG